MRAATPKSPRSGGDPLRQGLVVRPREIRSALFFVTTATRFIADSGNQGVPSQPACAWRSAWLSKSCGGPTGAEAGNRLPAKSQAHTIQLRTITSSRQNVGAPCFGPTNGFEPGHHGTPKHTAHPIAVTSPHLIYESSSFVRIRRLTSPNQVSENSNYEDCWRPSHRHEPIPPRRTARSCGKDAADEPSTKSAIEELLRPHGFTR